MRKQDVVALAYGRQSQGNDRSIEEQIQSGKARAGTEGWRLLASYQDHVSASRYATRARDDWPRLLRDLERPDVKVLWLWETSRGDRRLSTWASMLEKCRDHDVRIYVETHGRLYDMANARDLRTLSEDGVDNAYESDKISDRTRRAMRANAANGIPQGQAPYGYRHEHDSYGRFIKRVIMPREATNVRELYARLREGWPLRAIARDWEARGIFTRTGRPFTAQRLRGVALNPAYAGLRVHLTSDDRRKAGGRLRLDTATESDWDPIITKEEFFAVYNLLTSPERRTSRPGRAVHLLSVSTAARCGVCDGPLGTEHRPMGKSQERQWMYFCVRSGHVRISEAGLDELAREAIVGYLSRRDVYRLFMRPESAPELEKVRGELAQGRAQRADLADAITKRGRSITWALAADEEFARQIAALEERERELAAPDRLRGLLAPGPDVAERWEAAPVAARREVAQIVLSPAHLGVMKVHRGKGRPVISRVTWDRS